jgi:hypothetical protein
MRAIGIDVHRDFCEVAVSEGGRLRSAGRVPSTPAELELLGASLSDDDEVVLEATGNALAIARIIEPHVARVVVASARELHAISGAKAKTDRRDARTLAKLLAAGMFTGTWLPGEEVRALRRRLAQRAQLVRARSRLKNEVQAALLRNLVGAPSATDLFGVAGRRWLADLVLPADERETLDSCLRTIAFLDGEVERFEVAIARYATRAVCGPRRQDIRSENERSVWATGGSLDEHSSEAPGALLRDVIPSNAVRARALDREGHEASSSSSVSASRRATWVPLAPAPRPCRRAALAPPCSSRRRRSGEWLWPPTPDRGII